jgi:hypothetical protein
VTVRLGALGAAALVVSAACSRASGPVSLEASTEAPAPSSSADSTATPATATSAAPSEASTESDTPLPPPRPVDPAPPGQATRTTLTALDRAPILRPQLARLRQHFAPDARGPFTLQRMALAAGRVGVLVARADESDPVVLLLDRDTLVFAKDRPTAGIAPPVVHATLAPAPERGVAVFAYVASMHIVAGRMWADDSNAYADIEVFHPDTCDALTVGYEAGMGWIVACASKTGTRAQRLRDDLTTGWGHEGIAIGTAGPVGPAQMAFDGTAIWTLTQRARAVGGDRTVTFRYDVDGHAQ